MKQQILQSHNVRLVIATVIILAALAIPLSQNFLTKNTPAAHAAGGMVEVIVNYSSPYFSGYVYANVNGTYTSSNCLEGGGGAFSVDANQTIKVIAYKDDGCNNDLGNMVSNVNVGTASPDNINV